MAQQLENRSGIKGGYWLAKLADQLPPERIPNTYTHLFYASVLPDAENNYELKIAGTETDHERLMKDFTNVLQQRTPQQMSFLSIGGRPEIPRPANSLADTFSSMASTQESRDAFIRNSISVARDYGFDGLDLDWEFPNNQIDMNNLSSLFREWRTAIEEDHLKNPGKPRLFLSAAVYFASKFFLDTMERTYNVDAINNNVDFVALRCYDYHRGDTTKTAAHACLYDPSNQRLNTDHGISTWIDAGLNPRKLVMGLPLYGRTWNLKNPNNHAIGDIADGTGPGNGFMTYHEIVSYNAKKNTKHTPDVPTVSAYSYSGTDWIGYDEEDSIRKKVRYAKDKQLGGYFFWALQYGKDGNLLKQPQLNGIYLVTANLHQWLLS